MLSQTPCQNTGPRARRTDDEYRVRSARRMMAISPFRGADRGLHGALVLRRVADWLGLIKFDPRGSSLAEGCVAAAKRRAVTIGLPFNAEAIPFGGIFFLRTSNHSRSGPSGSLLHKHSSYSISVALSGTVYLNALPE
jgi:hypothetical protein